MSKKYISSLSISLFIFLSSTTNADTIHIKLPSVVKTPEVKAKVIKAVNINVYEEEKNKEIKNKEVKKKVKNHDRGISFSQRVPPSYEKKKSLNNVDISAYLRAPLMSKDKIKSSLEKAGFNILAIYDIDKKGKTTSFIFTNKQISSLASKKTRGFAGNLRLLYDKTNGQISITNPKYLMKAFMQKEYDSKLANDTLVKISKAFNNLENSKDAVKSNRLDHFKFMDSMPYYNNMTKIASGTNDELLKRAKKSKKIIYEQHLENGSVILGVKLSRGTTRFVRKIGLNNAALLPYPVLIENGKARILAPQYYIAIMYPLLSMSEFMSIASVPDSIVKDCTRVFR